MDGEPVTVYAFRYRGGVTLLGPRSVAIDGTNLAAFKTYVEVLG